MKNARNGNLQGNCHSVSTTGFGVRLDSGGHTTRVHGHCDRVPVTRVFGLSPLGVQNDTDCPRTHTHTSATCPFV
jgi:hypothetical protein